MHKRLIIISISFLISCIVFADNKDDEKESGKDKNADDKKTTCIDSTMSDHLQHLERGIEDTLVFEDWDDTEGSSRDNGIVGDGDPAPYNNGTGIGMSNVIGAVLANGKRKYEVNFDIYPNPTVQTLYIDIDESPQMILIINLRGDQLIQNQGVNQIDVSSLPKGIYFIQLVYPDHIETKKFVKS